MCSCWKDVHEAKDVCMGERAYVWKGCFDLVGGSEKSSGSKYI